LSPMCECSHQAVYTIYTGLSMASCPLSHVKIVRRMAKNDLRELKSQFLEYLEIEKGRSIKTVENYDRYLTRFLTHTGLTSPAKVSEQAIREFRIHLNR